MSRDWREGTDNPTFHIAEHELETQIQRNQHQPDETRKARVSQDDNYESSDNDTIFEDKEWEGNFIGNFIE